MLKTKHTTAYQQQNEMLVSVLKELQDIKVHLSKFLLLFPEESVYEYKHPEKIQEAYYQAISE